MMEDSRRHPLTLMRRAIARSMTASALVPQFTIEVDARLDALANWRHHTEAHTPVSYSDVIIVAAARVLASHPRLNASFAEDAIIEHNEINIGFAYDLPDGLVAPAIRRADTLSLSQVGAQRKRLADAARAGKLGPEELHFTTFTVSNLGTFGIRRFRALVVPPQAAILAVGSLTSERTMSCSLSCDHRVVDGAPAARFLSDFVRLLEEPTWLEELLSDSLPRKGQETQD